MVRHGGDRVSLQPLENVVDPDRNFGFLDGAVKREQPLLSTAIFNAFAPSRHTFLLHLRVTCMNDASLSTTTP